MRVSEIPKSAIHNDTLWIFPNIQEETCRSLSESTGLSPKTIKILLARELKTEDEIRNFISIDFDKRHDPFLLKGMKEAVERIGIAIERNEQIGIYSDYDVDGISGAALLHHFFRDIGISCETIIPNRNDEVFSLTKDHIREFREKGVSLIITVDCGISNSEAVNFSQQEGVDVIITDHHQLPALIPNAFCIIHPSQPDCRYPFKFLSGVGLTFKLIEGLSRYLSQHPRFTSLLPDLRKYAGFVALGTVADIVSLTDENRVLVANGLNEISKGCCKGLDLLKRISGLQKKQIAVNDLAYRLNPKLNSPGKIDQAQKSFLLLTEEDEDKLECLLEDIRELNLKRQLMQEKVLKEAYGLIENTVDMDESAIIVLASPDWHTGVLGSVATRIVERYNRPVILFHLSPKGFAKGSGRSIPTYNLFEGLQENAHLVTSFGGHKLAAGITIDVDKLNPFRHAMNQTVMKEIPFVDLKPRIRFDLEIRFDELENDFLEEMTLLAPFGIGNPTPLFFARNIWIDEEPKRVGKHGEHITLQLHDQYGSISVIGFYMADILENMDWEGVSFEVLFSPILSSPDKMESIRFFLRKIRPSLNPL